MPYATGKYIEPYVQGKQRGMNDAEHTAFINQQNLAEAQRLASYKASEDARQIEQQQYAPQRLANINLPSNQPLSANSAPIYSTEQENSQAQWIAKARAMQNSPESQAINSTPLSTPIETLRTLNQSLGAYPAAEGRPISNYDYQQMLQAQQQRR